MTDVLEDNISEKCPKCWKQDFKKVQEKAIGWKKVLGILTSFSSGTHSKYVTYKTICANCGQKKNGNYLRIPRSSMAFLNF